MKVSKAEGQTVWASVCFSLRASLRTTSLASEIFSCSAAISVSSLSLCLASSLANASHCTTACRKNKTSTHRHGRVHTSVRGRRIQQKIYFKCLRKKYLSYVYHFYILKTCTTSYKPFRFTVLIRYCTSLEKPTLGNSSD